MGCLGLFPGASPRVSVPPSRAPRIAACNGTYRHNPGRSRRADPGAPPRKCPSPGVSYKVARRLGAVTGGWGLSRGPGSSENVRPPQGWEGPSRGMSYKVARPQPFDSHRDRSQGRARRKCPSPRGWEGLRGGLDGGGGLSTAGMRLRGRSRRPPGPDLALSGLIGGRSGGHSGLGYHRGTVWGAEGRLSTPKRNVVHRYRR